MIDGVGVDIIEVSRIRNAISRWGDSFLNRIFTPWEITYCRRKAFPEQSFAARFAVKEAVLKAVGTGYKRGIKWTSVEIVNDEFGQPSVRLGERVTALIGNKRIIVSMSHTRDMAIGSAIMFATKRAHHE